jgi:ABC-type nitrate/sulfonate/bicarbonate transport system substrate-binding protein
VQLSYVLRSHGIDPVTDVNLVQGLGSDAERIGAIVSGSIDFTLVQPDFRNIYETAKLTKLLNVMDEKGSDFVMSGTFTKTDYAKAHPDLVEAYIKAIAEALTYMRNNAEGTIQIVSKYSQRPQGDLKSGYELYRGLMQQKPLVPRELVASSLETLKLANPEAAKALPESLFDASIVSRLDSEGVLDRIAREGGK